MKFQTYKLGSGTALTGGWWWQVIKTGPQAGALIIVVAKSGHAYLTEKDAITGYNEFVKWASQLAPAI